MLLMPFLGSTGLVTLLGMVSFCPIRVAEGNSGKSGTTEVFRKTLVGKTPLEQRKDFLHRRCYGILGLLKVREAFGAWLALFSSSTDSRSTCLIAKRVFRCLDTKGLEFQGRVWPLRLQIVRQALHGCNIKCQAGSGLVLRVQQATIFWGE